MLNNERDIYGLICNDADMMRTLREAASLELPDWYIGAGFLRNRIWDKLSGIQEQSTNCDVDVAYFDPTDIRPERDAELEQRLCTRFPHEHWEVRNQARMHIHDGYKPYTSCADAIAHWPETATAVGCHLDEKQELELLFTHGVKDLLNLIARPVTNNGISASMQLVLHRVKSKGWRDRWPELRVLPARTEPLYSTPAPPE